MPRPIPPILKVETTKVLKPEVNDLLFNPTKTEEDKMPNNTKLNNSNNRVIVRILPIPIHTHTRLMPISAINKRPGAKSSSAVLSSFCQEAEVAVVSRCEESGSWLIPLKAASSVSKNIDKNTSVFIAVVLVQPISLVGLDFQSVHKNKWS